MKILFFSDVHGATDALDIFRRRTEEEDPDLLVLLGDALHGGFTAFFPGGNASAAARLNLFAPRLIAVRGNCDSESDQAALSFPMLCEYSTLFADNVRFFLTHGHLWNEYHPPLLTPGSVLACGHTHVPALKRLESGLILFNPGSLAFPRRNSPRSFGKFQNGVLSLHELDSGHSFLSPLSL